MSRRIVSAIALLIAAACGGDQSPAGGSSSSATGVWRAEYPRLSSPIEADRGTVITRVELHQYGSAVVGHEIDSLRSLSGAWQLLASAPGRLDPCTREYR